MMRIDCRNYGTVVEEFVCSSVVVLMLGLGPEKNQVSMCPYGPSF